MEPLKNGPWKLSDLNKVSKNGFKVFSCFHCGGGSTMGYKLAGYEVLGGVEIDPEMMKVYKANHNPKFSYLMGVQQFNKIPKNKIPKELLNLDILDGSPPCSSFSMSGSRESAWGDKKKFREGQANQVLDDLFFHFIETARILQPKIVIAENVKGLVMGKAKGYIKQIAKAFDLAGYDLQLFILNAAFMGVPQRRERTFFIGKRKSAKVPKLSLKFKEPLIPAEKAFAGVDPCGRPNSADQNTWWRLCKPGFPFSSVHPKGSWFNSFKINPKSVAPTVTASAGSSASGFYHWSKPNHLSEKAYARLQTFPEDFDYQGLYPVYINGMSVPPFMSQRIALEIQKQWLDKWPAK